jgi:asparaginyl-tRNA synthetase
MLAKDHPQRLRIAQALRPESVGRTVTCYGWVRTVRAQKNFAFVELNDGSCFSNLQVIIDESAQDYVQLVEQLTTGCSIAVTGELVPSPGAKQHAELRAHAVEVLGTCPADVYPLQKKRHSLEFLRTIAHLRPRSNTLGAMSRIRNALAYAIHQFFQQRGFLYVQTPVITSSDCEGAGQMFRVTTMDLERLPRTPDGKVDTSQDFFGKSTYLTVSGQLEGEAYACALNDIYTFGPTFRAENSNTSRHLAEFWMIEPEMAFATLEDDMELAESFLKFVLKAALERCPDDFAFFNQWVRPGLLDRLQKVIQTPFKRLTYTEAVEILSQSGETFEFPCHWGADLQSEHERYLCEKVFQGPVILINYPKEIKSFYMRLNDDGKTVAAMDILCPDIGEVIGGSQREDRLELLKERMLAAGLNPEDYEWYLQLREFGSVPHAGFGLGFERLVQFATGLDNIRDCIPFPRFPGHAEF